VSCSRSHARFRGALAATEVAISLVLLAGAGLLLHSFSRLESAHTGVRTDHTRTMAMELPEASYKTRAQVAEFDRQAVEQLHALHGVESAGLVPCAPVDGHCSDTVFQIEGHPLPPGKLMDTLFRAPIPVTSRHPAPPWKYPHFQIVGGVGDVVKRLDAPVQPTMYLPLLDCGSREAHIIMHTAGDPHGLANAARHRINALVRHPH
jgi:hypothetical protein